MLWNDHKRAQRGKTVQRKVSSYGKDALNPLTFRHRLQPQVLFSTVRIDSSPRTPLQDAGCVNTIAVLLHANPIPNDPIIEQFSHHKLSSTISRIMISHCK